MSPQLAARHSSVLFALVGEFILTGEPVGSQTLVRKHGLNLSPATVRGVLADLEHRGFLTQPHRSAGRIPTESAFRLFVQALHKTQRLPPGIAAKISSWLEDLTPSSDLLRSTGKLLSELASAPAIVTRVLDRSRKLLKIQFIPTRLGEVLSVVVFADGTVENRFIKLDTPLSPRALDRIHALLEDVVEGRTLTDVRAHFATTCAAHRDILEGLGAAGCRLVDAVLDTVSRAREIIVEGQARLLDNPHPAQGEQLRSLMRALEDRERLLMMLDRIDATREVQVFLGGEIGDTSGGPMSLVAAPFRVADGTTAGTVGIIGPARMDYTTVVPMVGATADAVGTVLARGDIRG